jgi:transposase-like protein
VAAAALILGQNVRKTAEEMGVDRRTIQRWRKLDPEFQAALHEAKQAAVLTSRQSLLALAESAVEMVETKLGTEQNPRVALALLRGLGVLAPPVSTVSAEQAEPATEKFGVQSATSDSPTAPAEAGLDPGSLELEATDRLEAAIFEEVVEREDLNPAQQTALDALFQGKSLAEVAALAETPEEQIRGWLADDRRFATVLSGLQFDRICKLRYRLIALAQQAVEIVRKAVESGDTRLALSLLRGLGLMR